MNGSDEPTAHATDGTTSKGPLPKPVEPAPKSARKSAEKATEKPSIAPSAPTQILTTPKARERAEWQLMLSSVLKGDVIRAEKQRLGTTETGMKHIDFADLGNELWLGIKAKMDGRSIADERLYVEEMRKTEADKILEKVIHFEVTAGDHETAYDQVVHLLAQVDEVESLYPSRRAMIRDKPIYSSLPFQYNLEALNAWIVVSRSLKQQLQILTSWSGSDLDMKGESARPFIERILKETGVLGTFDKMDVLNDLLRKAKHAMTQNAPAFAKMKLPIYTDDVQKLAQFPNNLMEEFLKVRLEYTENLMKPLSGGGPQAVGELLEDLKASLSLAARIKTDTLNLNEPAPGWAIVDSLSETYDEVMLNSLRFYFKLLAWKFKTTTDTSFYKEAEMLEPEYEFLRTEVAPHLEGSDVEIGEQFCKLVEELLKKVTAYCQAQMNVAPGSLFINDSDKESTTLAPAAPNPQVNLTKWYKSRVLESVRARSRKLISFTKQMTSGFDTSAEYVLNDMDGLIKNLQDTKHILVDVTGSGKGVTSQGYLVFVSSDLENRPAQIRKLLRSCFTRRMPDDKTPGDDGYALMVAPGRDKHVRWGKGSVMKMHDPVSGRGHQLKPARVRLIADDGEVLALCRERFESDVGTTVVTLKKESKIHAARVHLAMKGVERSLYNLTHTIMDSLKVVRQTIRKTGVAGVPSMTAAHDLIEDWFTFASDYGTKASKNVGGSSRRQALQLRMNRLAIEWLEFIIHDCVSTDKRTFRWSLFALEFALKITEEQHIYDLTDEEFTLMRLNVARCMALLISHFDVQGARQSARDAAAHEAVARARRPLNLTLPDGDVQAVSVGIDPVARLATRDDWMRLYEDLEAERQRRQRTNRMIGKVLDDRNIEDRNISLLASASSSISLRWQQGKFLGGGSYGSVYMAINFDSGDVMAVKEIRFQDVSSLEALKRTIKEEMTVMQMLHHPNIVAYYGVEVHRDKLYIFMEYCPNSLSSLLEHGRIEDEMVIRIYTKQMLNGLEYLHSNNIVHRDVKPANTLIDAHGSIKFVDFGASKIYRNQKTIALDGDNASLIGTPHYMVRYELVWFLKGGLTRKQSPEVITGEVVNLKQGAQDIWSLGCCVLEMVTGKKPWAHLDNEWAIMYHIGISNKAPPLPDTSQLSQEGIDFLTECFIRPAKDRPSAHDLLQHPWIKDVDENQLLLAEPLASPSIDPYWSVSSPIVTTPNMTTPSPSIFTSGSSSTTGSLLRERRLHTPLP